MNKFLLKFTAFLLVLAGIVSSCNPECPECPNHKDEYPKDIAFTEYSLLETSCQWVNLPYDEKVLIINSSEELGKYISCMEGNYPAIDFSRYTLLLVSGNVNNSISEIAVKKIKQISVKKFILSIELDLIYKDNTEPWNKAIVVVKLSDESNIILNIIADVPKIIRPITIDWDIEQFFNWALPVCTQCTCFFPDIIEENQDSCILINNTYGFQQICACINDLPPGIDFPKIDFEKYTLVVGKKRTAAFIHFVDQKIIENNTLTLIVQKYSSDGPQWDCVKYHWGIYPKLPDKQFYVEYKYEDE